MDEQAVPATTIPEGWSIASVSRFDTRECDPALGVSRRKGVGVQLLNPGAVFPIVRGEAETAEAALAIAVAKVQAMEAHYGKQ